MLNKFWAAVIGGILVSLNVCLNITHGTAHDVITVVIAGLTAFSVYAVPNTPRATVTAPPTSK